jgi:glutathione S-transferase
MKLYITKGSPYARMVRVVMLEKGLENRIEVFPAQTRVPGSPYYGVNPSGRVPYLIRDDGVAFEDSKLICDYLDRLDGTPAFEPPSGEAGWQARRLESVATSMMDGIAVWARELMRAEGDRSATILKHEAERAERLATYWEAEINHPWMHGNLNMAQITLACALGFEPWVPDFHWRTGRPKLSAWFDQITARPSFANTKPPVPKP